MHVLCIHKTGYDVLHLFGTWLQDLEPFLELALALALDHLNRLWCWHWECFSL